MFTVIANLINAALGRPSVAKAVLCSLGLHVSAAAATFSWWCAPVDQMTLAGKRNVVQLDAAFAAEKSGPLEETEVSIKRFAMPPKPRKDAVEPLLATLVHPRATPTPVESELAPAELPEDHWEVVDPEVSRHEIDDSVDDPTETPPRELPRRQAEVLMPDTSVAAEQVAGVDDKTPPDLSGNRPPTYPARAIAQRLEGALLLRLHIAATGDITRVEIVTSSGHDIFDRAAVEAVSNWRGRNAPSHHRVLARTFSTLKHPWHRRFDGFLILVFAWRKNDETNCLHHDDAHIACGLRYHCIRATSGGLTARRSWPA